MGPRACPGLRRRAIRRCSFLDQDKGADHENHLGVIRSGSDVGRLF